LNGKHAKRARIGRGGEGEEKEMVASEEGGEGGTREDTWVSLTPTFPTHRRGNPVNKPGSRGGGQHRTPTRRDLRARVGGAGWRSMICPFSGRTAARGATRSWYFVRPGEERIHARWPNERPHEPLEGHSSRRTRPGGPLRVPRRVHERSNRLLSRDRRKPRRARRGPRMAREHTPRDRTWCAAGETRRPDDQSRAPGSS
jgi:hypothetical protein